jgi:hypothetical protein
MPANLITLVGAAGGDKGGGQNAAGYRSARCSCGRDNVHDDGVLAISLSDERRTTWRMAVRPRAVRRAMYGLFVPEKEKPRHGPA